MTLKTLADRLTPTAFGGSIASISLGTILFFVWHGTGGCPGMRPLPPLPGSQRALIQDPTDNEPCAEACGDLEPVLVMFVDGTTDCLCRPWGC